MRKILFVAYQFPPMGGPGVQRSTRFAEYLHEFGYEPVVFTVKEEDIQKLKGNIDRALLEYLPKNLEIIRTKSWQLFNFIKILNTLKIYRIFWFIFYPFLWERSALWPFFSYFKARKVVKERSISLIYTSSGPYSSMLLGLFLKKRNKIKWVADLRDPFTDAYAWTFPSKFHWLLSRRFEKWILKKPDILIVNTNEVRNLYIKNYGLDPGRVRVLTNGY